MIRRNYIYTIVHIALYISLLIISSIIVIPLPFTLSTITLQTIVINVLSSNLKPKHACLTVALYILLGIIGLPVFGGATSGIVKILSPIGGYYLGFIVSSFIMSIALRKNVTFKKLLLVYIFIGTLITHLCSITWMMFFNGFNLFNAILTMSLPFILTDIIKCVISAFISYKFKNTSLKN